jgi:hypothetical protein
MLFVRLSSYITSTRLTSLPEGYQVLVMGNGEPMLETEESGAATYDMQFQTTCIPECLLSPQYYSNERDILWLTLEFLQFIPFYFRNMPGQEE